MQKSLKSNEWRRIWVHRTSKTEIQKGRPNNSDFLQNWLPLEIKTPLFNLQKFLDPQKSIPDSCANDWNLMNDEVFGSIELLRLKYRREDHIIATFCQFVSNQKLAPPSFISRNFTTLRKVLLIHAEITEI